MQSSSSNSQHTPEDVDKLIEELPKVLFMEIVEICKWEGFWMAIPNMKPALIFRSSFCWKNT
ncbi:hypothetical protein ACS0TY_015704 [Phlomoides rotata]